MTAPTPDPDALAALAGYVQAPADSTYLARCLTDATGIIGAAIGGQTVPEFARQRAELEVAADLWHRRQARGGIATFDSPDSAPVPVRIARDALRAGWPYLAPHLPGGFA